MPIVDFAITITKKVGGGLLNGLLDVRDQSPASMNECMPSTTEAFGVYYVMCTF
jgi:hypothetical protein